MNKPWILSVSVAQHDASICLLHGDQIKLYLAEERISRQKHDSDLPLMGLEKIKDYVDYIDDLLFVNTTSKQRQYVINHLNKIGIFPNQIDSSDYHHLYHAASGFYQSGFDEALCLVVDGWGSAGDYFYTCDTWPDQEQGDGGISCDETTSIFKVNYPSIFSVQYKNVVYDAHRTDGLQHFDCGYRESLRLGKEPEMSLKDLFSSKGTDIEVSNSLDIGVMYGTVSSFLGFSELECGKCMGLAAYGEEDPDIPPMFFDHKLKANMNLFSQSRIINTFNYPHLENLDEKKRNNMAYAIQKALEDKFVQRVSFIDKNFDCKNIVISGGCGFNVVGNSVLVNKFPHINFFVDPLPHDAGQSIGRALLHYYQYYDEGDGKKRERVKDLYLGPEYNKDELKSLIYKSVERS